VPDYFQPGRDGALPGGVPEWREGLGELTTRGLIYTARGAQIVLACNRKYRIAAGFKQKVAKGSRFSNYDALYRRVTRLAKARADEMSCSGHGERLHATVLGHLWQCISGNSHDFPAAAVVAELSCARAQRPAQPNDPAPEALTSPGGTHPDEFSRLISKPMEEFYNEYDVGDPLSTSAEPFSFSYCEHVEDCAGIDFAPFVERAENRARFHYDLLVGHSGSAKEPFLILRRDWWTVPETLVVVVIYFQAWLSGPV
jgi:hypothetical protein